MTHRMTEARAKVWSSLEGTQQERGRGTNGLGTRPRKSGVALWRSGVELPPLSLWREHRQWWSDWQPMKCKRGGPLDGAHKADTQIMKQLGKAAPANGRGGCVARPVPDGRTYG